MELFRYCGTDPDRLLAVTETGRHLTLGDLNRAAMRLGSAIGGHRLVFLLCENTPGTLLGYLACLMTGAMPLLLDGRIAPDQLAHLAEVYRPAFFYVPDDLSAPTRAVLGGSVPVLTLHDSVLLRVPGRQGPRLHRDLALLLTTSGSTGSPKLVRLTGRNLDANARSIAEYLALTENERPITSLPMSYSYGMSVINSHLYAGAAVVLTRRGVLERPFWELMAREKVTSLAGVPHTYQMLQRVGLTDMHLPHLRTLTQAGGKLPNDLHRLFARWAADTGRRFFVMYGQTEAGPRMAYLPPEHAVAKCGSIGVPIPGGTMELADEDGRPVAGGVGEIVYQGENVAMGYAQRAEDLALADQWHGRLRTGDMARRDEDGFLYIVGRKGRFIKLYGSRVSLDDAERIISARFPGVDVACTGEDDRLRVFAATSNQAVLQEILDLLCQSLRFPPRTFSIRAVDAIPKNEAGKTLYSRLAGNDE